MFKSELYKIKKSRLKKNVILLLFVISIIHLFLVYYSSFDHSLGILHFFDIPYSERYNPAWASFLTSSAPGHIGYMLVIWIVPLYLLIISSDTYVTEKSLGLDSTIHTRISNKEFVLAKLGFAFVISFIIFGFLLLLNFIIANIIFFNGKEFGGIENAINDLPTISQFVYKNPTLGYLIYIFIACTSISTYNMVIVSLSFNIRRKSLLYVISIIVWFLTFTTPLNMANLIQPLTEYGFERIIPFSIIYFTLCLLIITLSTWRFMTNDKI